MKKLLPIVLFLLLFSAQTPVTQLPDGLSYLVCLSGQPPELRPPDQAYCSPAAPPPPVQFVETFDGAPAAPEPWQPDSWLASVHVRDREWWDSMESMPAGHGPDCSPPPATHLIHTYEEAVHQCANHVMTALNASSYGVIYLTPDHLVDFSQREAVVRFDVSTLRTSGRDWIDLWITPYEDNLQLPLEDWLPDLNGEPRRAIHIRMKLSWTGVFEGFVINNFEDSPIPQNSTLDYKFVLPPSAVIRSTFELRLSQTHVQFGLPDYGLWWLNSDIPPLDWDSGILQLGHHSYNPLKNCATCRPGTWHWDNVTIEPARPFVMLRADRRFADAANPVVRFSNPAPAGSHLRFSGIGDSIEVSFDGGSNWQPVQMQAQEEYHSDHFRSYWHPIPAGTTTVHLRGTDWWGDQWMARDIAIFGGLDDE